MENNVFKLNKCLWQDVTYSTIAKGYVGNLSDDITKAPYKALFNPSTNSYELLNAVLVVREIEKLLQNMKVNESGKKYATCVHANRLIEHIVLQVKKEETSFSQSVIDIANEIGSITTLLNIIIPAISNELETTFVDSYPANVFKNQAKTKAIEDAVMRVITASED